MGCPPSIEIYRWQKQSCEKHDDNDLVQIKEINGKTVQQTLYYDNKHDDIIKKENGKFYTTRILEMDGVKIIPIYLDGDEYVFVHYGNFIEKMKKKYHDDMREKIRNEVREEFSKTELLLP